MATIIDSLLVSLGFDTKDFAAGQARVNKGLKETGGEADKAAKKVTGLAESATKFLAVIGGAVALKVLVSDLIESSAALDRFTRNLDLSVESVSELGNAAELAGGSAKGLQGTLDMLSRTQTELQLTGQSGLIPYFSALGISIADVQGRARPVDALLLDLSDKFARMNRTEAFNMGRMMGIDEGTMNLLLKGRQEIETIMKRQQSWGDVMKKLAPEGSRLREFLIHGKQDFMTFAAEILHDAMPAIEKILGVLEDFGAWASQNKEFIKDFLAILAIGLGAVALAVTPINLTAVAVTGLAAAIALLWQDYQTWKRGGDSLIDWSKWEVGINAAKIGITAFKNFMSDAFYRMFAAADAAMSALHGDWGHAKWAMGEALSGNTSAAPTPGTNVPPTAGGRSLPRGVRNNNPGNLDFAGQAGATKESGGRFAVFGNMRQGVAALGRQIGLYISRGKNTIRKIIETYAPKGENNTAAYISAVSRFMGLDPDVPLNPSDTNQLMSLVKAIITHEEGAGYVSDSDISGGLAMAKGIPGASRAARGAGAGAVASAAGGLGMSTTSNEMHINEIKVYTNATDADGIAKDLHKSMDYEFTSQANLGMRS